MGDSQSFSRRRMLEVLGISGMASLSGCNNSDSEMQATDTETATATRTQTATQTESPTGTTEQPDDSKIIFDGGGTEAFGEALEELANTSGGTLEIIEGTYQFEPSTELSIPSSMDAHFEINGLENATIQGNGSKLVFSDPQVGMLHFYDSEGLTVQNLSFDYDPVPFTQGTVESLSEQNRSVTLSLDQGFPSLDHDMFDEAPFMWASVHTADGEFISGIRRERRLDKHFSSITQLSGDRYRLTLGNNSDLTGVEQGRRMAVVARGFNHALIFSAIDGLTLQDVNVDASPSFLIFLGYCTDAHLQGCTLASPQNSDRLVGSDADGIYCSSCRSGPTIEDCHIEQLLDDGIVISTPATWVTSFRDSRTIEVKNVTGVTADEGDVFEVKSTTGELKGKLPPVEYVEHYIKSPSVPGRPQIIRFENAIDDILEEGDYLTNTATGNRDFTIRNNTVRNNRASLIRVSGGSGTIKNNHLEGSSNPLIEIEADSSREFEAKGWVRNLSIQNNQIRRSGLNYFAHTECAAIHTTHTTPRNISTTGRPHRNIEIVNNEFENHAHLGLKLEDAKGIQVLNNSFSNLNQLPYESFFGKSGYGIGLSNINQAEIAENSVNGTGDELYQFGWQRASQRITSQNNELTINGEAVNPEIPASVPVTLDFDRTVKPSEIYDAKDDNPLSFFCEELSLLDGGGETILYVDVGGEEQNIEFGEDVYPPANSGRWFGGPSAQGVLYFLDIHLSRATQLQLRGYPIVDEISAEVIIDDKKADNITFGSSGETAEYTISISDY